MLMLNRESRERDLEEFLQAAQPLHAAMTRYHQAVMAQSPYVKEMRRAAIDAFNTLQTRYNEHPYRSDDMKEVLLGLQVTLRSIEAEALGMCTKANIDEILARIRRAALARLNLPPETGQGAPEMIDDLVESVLRQLKALKSLDARASEHLSDDLNTALSFSVDFERPADFS